MQSVPPGRAARPPAPLCLRSRAHIYGYGRSLRPPKGTSIAPRRRAVFRQTLLAFKARGAALALGHREPVEHGLAGEPPVAPELAAGQLAFRGERADSLLGDLQPLRELVHPPHAWPPGC